VLEDEVLDDELVVDALDAELSVLVLDVLLAL
jgi:hypothetical protein